MERLRDHTRKISREIEIADALASLDRFSFNASKPHRLIRGIAVSSAKPNSNDNSIVARGVNFSLPTPLLWNHEWMRPLGRITAIRARGDQLSFEAEIANNMEWAGEIWNAIISGDVGMVSVGLVSLSEPVIDRRFANTHLNEISVCQIGADHGAVITKCWSKLHYISLRERNETIFWSRED